MPSSIWGINDDQRVSRRRVVKGGILGAAGVMATMISRNAAADAVTPLDVKRVMSRPRSAPLAPLALLGVPVELEVEAEDPVAEEADPVVEEVESADQVLQP